jgi:hypothetical protein
VDTLIASGEVVMVPCSDPPVYTLPGREHGFTPDAESDRWKGGPI